MVGITGDTSGTSSAAAIEAERQAAIAEQKKAEEAQRQAEAAEEKAEEEQKAAEEARSKVEQMELKERGALDVNKDRYKDPNSDMIVQERQEFKDSAFSEIDFEAEQRGLVPLSDGAKEELFNEWLGTDVSFDQFLETSFDTNYPETAIGLDNPFAEGFEAGQEAGFEAAQEADAASDRSARSGASGGGASGASGGTDGAAAEDDMSLEDLLELLEGLSPTNAFNFPTSTSPGDEFEKAAEKALGPDATASEIKALAETLRKMAEELGIDPNDQGALDTLAKGLQGVASKLGLDPKDPSALEDIFEAVNRQEGDFKENFGKLLDVLNKDMSEATTDELKFLADIKESIGLDKLATNLGLDIDEMTSEQLDGFSEVVNGLMDQLGFNIGDLNGEQIDAVTDYIKNLAGFPVPNETSTVDGDIMALQDLFADLEEQSITDLQNLIENPLVTEPPQSNGSGSGITIVINSDTTNIAA